MSEIPWVKWYASNFLQGIADLEPMQIAVYTVVLNLIYDKNGPVEDDLARISRRCNARPTTVEKALDGLEKMGKIIRAGGFITNDRCEKELESREKVVEKSSKSAKKRWTRDEQKVFKKPNKINETSMRTHDPSIQPSMDLSHAIQNQNQNKKGVTHPTREDALEIASPLEVKAEEFYKAYPKKADPEDAKKKFIAIVKSRKLNPDDVIFAAVRYAEAHQRAGTEKKFIPAPAVWLNKGGYASEDLPQPRGYQNGKPSAINDALDWLGDAVAAGPGEDRIE